MWKRIAAIPRNATAPSRRVTCRRLGALSCAPLLALMALGLSWALLPPSFLGVLVCYLAANLAYSAWLKRKPMIDVLLLANMYTLRLGGWRRGHGSSALRLVAGLCDFLFSVAGLCQAILRIGPTGQRAARKGRRPGICRVGPEPDRDHGPLQRLYVGAGAGPVSQQRPGPKTVHPRRLFVGSLRHVLLYWISRLWFWAKRGEPIEDPVAFALTDRNSLIAAAVGACLLWAAARGG